MGQKRWRVRLQTNPKAFLLYSASMDVYMYADTPEAAAQFAQEVHSTGSKTMLVSIPEKPESRGYWASVRSIIATDVWDTECSIQDMLQQLDYEKIQAVGG